MSSDVEEVFLYANIAKKHLFETKNKGSFNIRVYMVNWR